MRVSATDRREQLIDATIQVMRRDGVRSVTLRAIAAEANASLAAVHYCFEDKDALLHASIERWLKTMVTDAMQVPTDEGVRASVMRMANAYWTSLIETPDDILAQLELVLWASRADPSKPLASSIYPRYERELTEMMERALDAADERCDWNLGEFSRALLVVIDGCSMQFLSQPKRPGHRELYDCLLESLFLRAGIEQASAGRARAASAG